MSGNDWAVFRLDFNGNEFLVEQDLTEERAHELVLEFESHKHHQHYWACRVPEPAINYTQMLRDLLNNGSTLDVSLAVLRNQNATVIQCIKAVRDVRGWNLAESKRAVLQSPVFADQLERHNSLVEQLEAELENET